MILKRALLSVFAAVFVTVAGGLWFYAWHSGGMADGDDEDKPIDAPERVSLIDGTRVITLDARAQAQNGIVTLFPRPANAASADVATARVIDASGLIDLARRYRRARADDPVLAGAIERTIAQRYGAGIGPALASRTSAIEGLLHGNATLVDVESALTGEPPATLSTYDVRGRHLTLQRIGAGPPGHWLYAADAGLVPGDPVTVALPVASARSGVTLPASAVVWHDGAPWVYVRRAGRLFTRVRLAAAVPQADGGYRTAALTPHDEIVVQGAELLLSEELRAYIQNEG